MSKYLFIILAAFLSGCSSISTAHRPVDYYNSSPTANLNELLFSSTNETLIDRDIERILNHQLKLPAKSRVAILKLSNEVYWNHYSDDFNQLTESIATDFVNQLRSSPRIYDASFLPAMLIPQKRTIPFLREAAARYQSDLLLAYRSNCHTFKKYRFIDPNETRAYCTVEVVLLDVRTGIVPFTMVSTNEFNARKQREETNFNETIKKAELSAIAKSLKESTTRLVSFIAEVDTL